MTMSRLLPRAACLADLLFLLMNYTAHAKTDHYYVANTQPPPNFLALRTAPSLAYGQRVEAMRNGTLLEVFEKRPDGWWLVRDIGNRDTGLAAASGNSASAWIVCCAPTSSPEGILQPVDTGFITPSGNISCLYSAIETDQPRDPTLRCDIREHITARPRPPDCDLEWGDAFEIHGTSSYGAAVCHGDTTFASGLPVLRYGAVWSNFGLTCTSETTGLTCLNALGHGFRLSRTVQEVF